MRRGIGGAPDAKVRKTSGSPGGRLTTIADNDQTHSRLIHRRSRRCRQRYRRSGAVERRSCERTCREVFLLTIVFVRRCRLALKLSLRPASVAAWACRVLQRRWHHHPGFVRGYLAYRALAPLAVSPVPSDDFAVCARTDSRRIWLRFVIVPQEDRFPPWGLSSGASRPATGSSCSASSAVAPARPRAVARLVTPNVHRIHHSRARRGNRITATC